MALLAGGAAWMTPRGGRALSAGALQALAPSRVSDWSRTEGLDVIPETAGADTERNDRSEAYGYIRRGFPPIAMLISYHGAESLEIKVHRPEVCYQVAGFTLSGVTDCEVRLADSLQVAARRFSAVRSERHEQVLYWTRLGSAFPRTLAEQRLAGLRAGLARKAVDGLLVRLSIVSPAGMPEAWPMMESFARTLYRALDPAARDVLA